MVFRKESRHDSFQRQISALRQQLSSDQDDEDFDDATPLSPIQMAPPAMVGWDETPVPTAPDLPNMPSADSTTGVVSANSTFTGTLRSDGSVHIFGSVEGEIIAADDVFVADGASVTARVTARDLMVAGVVDGSITCSHRLEVLPSGRVAGDITSPTLVVHEGATVTGDLRMRSPGSASSSSPALAG